MSNVQISSIDKIINYESDKIILTISQINGLFDDDYANILMLSKVPQLSLVSPAYSLPNIKEGITIKGSYFENKQSLQAKITYSTFDVINSNKVEKKFVLFIKAIYIDANTIFLNFPDIEFVKYNFNFPIIAHIYITNNNLEYSLNFLEFEILNYPRISHIQPNKYLFIYSFLYY